MLMTFVPKSPVGSKLALAQVTAWCQKGEKPLPEPMLSQFTETYRQVSNISCTLGNRIVDHSDIVGASPVGAAPTTSSFST